ncbi:IS1634 family transposase [Thermotalea metallivorans]|uniref:DUF4277 domain-containing protein n=2 Tax=Thermotaleaceae TaxID=3118657 RepID=A0A140KZA0_9FIRM|nr:IS1634 family transposase [Thermotalea metallivorans]KXG73625.1 hypothetical protein AN619_30370 [Thermotalea metallivorans]
MNFNFDQIQPHFDGKAGFIAGLAQQIGLDHIFNQALEQHTGRPPEISYGTLAQLMLINIADDHHPLSRLNEYFERVDLESLLGHKIDPCKLNDDRFGGFLDAMFDYGCSAILSDVAVAAFKRYGIKLSNVNFDTTSKVMWGEYKTDEGILGAVNISFGYSKQKRFDKKQIKFSMGTTQGICIDGQVLSGDLDDKRFNIDNLDRAAALRKQFETHSDEFFYIADSAAFTKEFLEKADQLNVHVITRMPDNVKETKAAIEVTLEKLSDLPIVEIETSTDPSVYKVFESECIYHETSLKLASCYSEKLKPAKTETIMKKVAKELENIEKVISSMKERSFVCHEDAVLEMSKIQKGSFSKLRYHNVKIEISTSQKRRPGRPSKNPEQDVKRAAYHLGFEVIQDDLAIETSILKECIFVVASTKLDLSAKAILCEYKTQSAVERKFQFLKSPQFVNSLYVDSPRRVEAIGYLMILLMLLLSIAEYVVRRELAQEKAFIIGPGKVKMTKPSLLAIYRIFYSVATVSITIDGQIHRGFSKELAPNVKTILRYLGIPENIYIRGAS